MRLHMFVAFAKPCVWERVPRRREKRELNDNNNRAGIISDNYYYYGHFKLNRNIEHKYCWADAHSLHLPTAPFVDRSDLAKLSLVRYPNWRCRATKRKRNGAKAISCHCVKIQFATGDTFNVFFGTQACVRSVGRSFVGSISGWLCRAFAGFEFCSFIKRQAIWSSISKLKCVQFMASNKIKDEWTWRICIYWIWLFSSHSFVPSCSLASTHCRRRLVTRASNYFIDFSANFSLSPFRRLICWLVTIWCSRFVLQFLQRVTSDIRCMFTSHKRINFL